MAEKGEVTLRASKSSDWPAWDSLPKVKDLDLDSLLDDVREDRWTMSPRKTGKERK